MSEYNYKDPVRVECLKHDWEQLYPTDQATLLVEWGAKTVDDFKTDWKAKLLSWGKWLLLAVAGALTAGYTAMALSSCEEINPMQIQAAHTLYHVVSGEPCILYVEGDGK